jgi:hypothetical protein
MFRAGEFASRPGREDSRQLVPRWHSTNYLIASAAILSVTNASIVSPALMSP